MYMSAYYHKLHVTRVFPASCTARYMRVRISPHLQTLIATTKLFSRACLIRKSIFSSLLPRFGCTKYMYIRWSRYQSPNTFFLLLFTPFIYSFLPITESQLQQKKRYKQCPSITALLWRSNNRIIEFTRDKTAQRRSSKFVILPYLSI
jgi:hypothetical protein